MRVAEMHGLQTAPLWASPCEPAQMGRTCGPGVLCLRKCLPAKASSLVLPRNRTPQDGRGHSGHQEGSLPVSELSCRMFLDPHEDFVLGTLFPTTFGVWHLLPLAPLRVELALHAFTRQENSIATQACSECAVSIIKGCRN